MIQAYRLNIIEKPKYMYSKAQFESALRASGLIGKKVSRFYTEFPSADDTVLVDSKGYSLICNNVLIIETEDGDWYEFFVAGEGAIAFSKNAFIKQKIFTITGRENDEWVVSEIAYDPFKSYWCSSVVGFEIVDDNNLAYVPKNFEASEDAILPQSITFIFEDGASLTVLGEHDFIDVEFDTSVPRKRFRESLSSVLQEEIKEETDKDRITERSICIDFLSRERTSEEVKEYYLQGLLSKMSNAWEVDLYTNNRGFSFLELAGITSFRVSNPKEIANRLLSLGLQFIDYDTTRERHRVYQSFSFVSEDNGVQKTHTLYYYFDCGIIEHVCVTLDQKKRISEKLFKERKQNRWLPSSFIEDIWCIGTRYNLDGSSLEKLQDYLRQWEKDNEESARRIEAHIKKK